MLFVIAVLANEHKTSIKIFTLGGGLHAEQGTPSLLFPVESQKVHCSASLPYCAPESFFFPEHIEIIIILQREKIHYSNISQVSIFQEGWNLQTFLGNPQIISDSLNCIFIWKTTHNQVLM